MQELILLPFLELGRRRIRAQTTATDSFSKPSTSPTLNNPINRDLLLQRKAHSIFIQEQVTPQDKAPMTQAYFTKHTVFLSPTDPDSAKPSAGVGLIAAQGIRCTNPVAGTDKLVFFRQQGRADIYNLDMRSSTALMVINLHGWQGAEDHIARFQHGYRQQSGDEETHK